MTQNPSPSHTATDRMETAPDAGRSAPPVDTDALTQALRQSFQATVDEGVPDSLMDLISKLK